MSTRQRRSNAGLATLEWLLVIAAAGGFAAAMTAGLDQLIADRTTSPPADPPASHTAARIDAARINDRTVEALAAVHAAVSAGDAQAVEAASARLELLKHACERLPRLYPDALTDTAWEWQPIALPGPPATPTANDDEQGTQDETENDGEPRIETGSDDPATEPSNDGRWVCSVGGRPS